MSLNIHLEIGLKLMDIQAEIVRLQLWSDQRPDESAFSSQQPFCLDTMRFNEWLQFVFVERMRQLTEKQAELPEKCEIAPMAEEFFRQEGYQASELVKLIKQVDELITFGEARSTNS